MTCVRTRTVQGVKQLRLRNGMSAKLCGGFRESMVTGMCDPEYTVPVRVWPR